MWNLRSCLPAINSAAAAHNVTAGLVGHDMLDGRRVSTMIGRYGPAVPGTDPDSDPADQTLTDAQIQLVL
ncbi:MAG TPA: hypothetical protein DGG94_10685 [Micromonosporaceae bacterium]|nr:hypothetical protein [Micromonosporaceae bacterium]HCU50245.1 hypothetical protein [Micromonosporaceae bacterium]